MAIEMIGELFGKWADTFAVFPAFISAISAGTPATQWEPQRNANTKMERRPKSERSMYAVTVVVGEV